MTFVSTALATPFASIAAISDQQTYLLFLHMRRSL